MIFIFESHPVQYRAPFYRELQRLKPDQFMVVYASDCSVRGYRDAGFGVQVRWDEPLLEGYPSMVLNNERGIPLDGPRSLHGGRIINMLFKLRPSAVYLTAFSYEFEWVAFLASQLLGIPVWLRTETQDEAYKRSVLKSWVRYLIYKVVYAGLSRAFYIGELNRDHLLRHGVPASRLTRSPYGVVDRWDRLTMLEARSRGLAWRNRLGIDRDAWVVGFFGKLIGKKNPALLLEACAALPVEARESMHIVMVGSGVEEPALQEQAKRLHLRVLFCGFINQSVLADYYLGVDTMVLPSKREGETWGLVVNEALLSGCSVVMSDAVGCYREFGKWERVRVFRSEDVADCAAKLAEVSGFRHKLSWCRKRMENYSVHAAAVGIAAHIP